MNFHFRYFMLRRNQNNLQYKRRKFYTEYRAAVSLTWLDFHNRMFATCVKVKILAFN